MLTSTLPLETLGSVAFLLPASFCHGNHNRDKKALWYIKGEIYTPTGNTKTYRSYSASF